MNWVNKDTEIYCSFAKTAGNTGCQMMNSAFYYHGLNKIYKSFSIDNIEDAVNAVKALSIKGFAITMPYKKQVLGFVDDMEETVKCIGAANTVINTAGSLHAYNTDYLAAKDFLKDSFSCYSAEESYILGDGGYSAAVREAFRYYDIDPKVITRADWDGVKDIRDSLVYNCTPVENLPIHESNRFIDCIVASSTGLRLATMQASHQYELYTGLKFPY